MAFTKPRYHILVCSSFRVSGEPQGICHRKGASDLLSYLESECTDRGLDALVSSTGCLKVCEKGPIVVIYPGSPDSDLEHPLWYGEVDEVRCDAILDALEEGETCADGLL